ncbi:MAG: hypothetical protein KC656_20020 [Myxococcales bacterium]|nr:hypothetical protein [Myxococcales bacterium]MCB9671456.1 hypothetical protein [Alphaproteobacteria bacterium]MCB9693298.1 hypothetical protein [Alphaproteobacteria bacterium]
MEKGDRVQITGGRQGRGKSGSIFWKGPNKFGPGDRFGVKGDDGATYWVLEADVRPASGDAPEAPPERTFEKGARVQLQHEGQQVTGHVFWTGQSKVGGQRLGVRTEPDEATVWIDARYVEPAEGGAAPEARSGPQRDSAPAPTHGDDDVADIPHDYGYGDASMAPEPPVDDDMASWASDEEDIPW